MAAQGSAAPRFRDRCATIAAVRTLTERGILALLRCPACGGELHDGSPLSCGECERVYEVVEGVPVLLSSGEKPEPAGEHKRRQSEFFDAEADPEWEVVRPHGAPKFHRFLLREKFRRGTRRLASELRGASALSVCGGSGMDAEFLLQAGAEPVVCADLSLGAALRALERARRFGLALTPVVADVERLPFADRSFDVVYVHDGLHHLEDPLVGLREMARVARVAVSVNEPAKAKATAAAVRTGLSIDYEEAGNRVERMSTDQIRELLEGEGFEIKGAERYAMLYRHQAGVPLKALSAPGISALAQGGWRAANALIGPAGNKLTVQAVRRDT
jgi:ubiquinone/menaquinone biosynthesis C-methylase UbiE/uncharacterized protein YbaR (Trm112 family)